MKHFLMLLVLLLASLLPAQAKNEVGQLLGGLLQVISEPQQTTSSSTPSATPATPGFGDQLVLTLRGATDSLMEGYKQEGREYAKEVGDIITQRMLENKKLNNTLDSVRYLCWGVVGYLTVVTLLILVLLLRLRVLYARLMATTSKENSRGPQ
jgi:hypothetical protein